MKSSAFLCASSASLCLLSSAAIFSACRFFHTTVGTVTQDIHTTCTTAQRFTTCHGCPRHCWYCWTGPPLAAFPPLGPCPGEPALLHLESAESPWRSSDWIDSDSECGIVEWCGMKWHQEESTLSERTSIWGYEDVSMYVSMYVSMCMEKPESKVQLQHLQPNIELIAGDMPPSWKHMPTKLCTMVEAAGRAD